MGIFLRDIKKPAVNTSGITIFNRCLEQNTFYP